jgi:ribosomal protein S18 acetylase RimI-like enzyme
VVTLQDAERQFLPSLPSGEEIADRYLTLLVDQCIRMAGHILVADDAGKVVGFVCVLTRVPPQQPEEAAAEYAYITDLVVLSPYRGQGLGRRLVAEAETAARAAGAMTLRVGVLARNQSTRDLYRKLGFLDFRIEFTKAL